MAHRRFESLLDVARKGYWVRIQCRCGHTAKHNPMTLVELLMRRDCSLRLDRLHQSLKCGKCGGKEFTATHCEGPEIWSG